PPPYPRRPRSAARAIHRPGRRHRGETGCTARLCDPIERDAFALVQEHGIERGGAGDDARILAVRGPDFARDPDPGALTGRTQGRGGTGQEQALSAGPAPYSRLSTSAVRG